MLKGYKRVDCFADVPINTRIRYFIVQQDGTRLFRTGGFLLSKANSDIYVILRNHTTWVVRVKDAVFFSKLSVEEEELAAKDEIITQLRLELASCVDCVRSLKTQLDEAIIAIRSQLIGPSSSITLGDSQ